LSELTYSEVGATAGDLPPGYRHVRASRILGHGEAVFDAASDVLLDWEMHERSGIGRIVGPPEAIDQVVTATITAFSRPASRLARLAGPVGTLAQRWMTHRYLRAIGQDDGRPDSPRVSAS